MATSSSNNGSASAPGGYYEVRQGDSLSLIALLFGFKDHLPIYNDPENADFKQQRPNPNILFPGDRVFIPQRVRQEACSTDQRWKFVLSVPKKVLRITVENDFGEAIVGAPYQLIVEATSRVAGRLEGEEGKTFQGSTGDGGIIEHPVPVNATKATLKVGCFVRDIAIGTLNPERDTPDNGVSGIQARLSNLGFDPGPIDGIPGPRTEVAIRSFQAKHPPLEVDGICGPQTLARLRKEHKS